MNFQLIHIRIIIFAHWKRERAHEERWGSDGEKENKSEREGAMEGRKEGRRGEVGLGGRWWESQSWHFGFWNGRTARGGFH